MNENKREKGEGVGGRGEIDNLEKKRHEIYISGRKDDTSTV